MSVSLMRKGIRLLEDESKGAAAKKSSSGKRQLKKGKPHRPTQKNKNGGGIMKSGKMKSAVDEYRRKQMGDMTESNLQILQQLSALKPKSEAAQKILSHHTKKLRRNLSILPEPQQSEPKSILFPEENKLKKKKKV